VTAFDMPLEQLRGYRPERDEPADFDGFWSTTLAEARQQPVDVKVERVDTGLRMLHTYDVAYRGFGGQEIRAWLVLPATRSGPLPCVVEYVGYGGGRGMPVERLTWAAAGFANLVMDNRGQGTWGPVGVTPDAVPETEAAHPGYMTRGILDPADHYYRRLITDAVRAVDAVAEMEAVDASRLAAYGRSQGGGLALRWPGSSRESARSCRTSRSCATTGGRPRSPSRNRTARSSATSATTVIAWNACSGPWRISTG
jgi:cephalosporin-C deacetylase